MKNLRERKDLNSEINEYKREIISETGLIIYYALSAYLSSLINFGVNSSVTKDCLAIIKEFSDINYYESAY